MVLHCLASLEWGRGREREEDWRQGLETDTAAGMEADRHGRRHAEEEEEDREEQDACLLLYFKLFGIFHA